MAGSDIKDQTGQDVSDEKLRQITGLTRGEEKAMEARAASDNISSTEEKAEGDKLGSLDDETIGEGYKAPKRKRFKITGRQKAASGGVAGLLIGGGIGLFTVISGPLQIIHLSSLLSIGIFSRDNETHDTSARRIYNTLSGNPERNNLSALGSALAKKNRADLLAKGIDLDFKTPEGKSRAKIQSFKVNIDSPEGKDFLNSVTEGLNAVEFDPEKRIATISLRGKEGTALARQSVDKMVEISGKKKVSALITKRRLKKLMGVDFHPLRNQSKSKLESISDYIKKRRAERAEAATEGTETKSVGDAAGSEPDAEGKTTPPDAQLDIDGDNIKETIDDTVKVDDPFERRTGLKGIGGKLLKIGGAAAAVASITCSVRDVGNQIPKFQMLNVIKPLVRLSIQYVAAGSQVQAMQDININEVASIVKPLYDEQNKTSWASAAPIKAMSGETGGTEINSATKSQITNAYNANKPLLFDVIDSIPGIGVVCKANDWFGNLPIVKQFGEATSKLISGGVGAITGKSLEEWMSDLVSFLAGGSIDTLAEGANLGNLLAYGGVLSSNTSSIAAGGTALNNQQTTAWNTYLYKENVKQMKNKSFYARFLNIKDSVSLAGRLSMKVANINKGSLIGHNYIYNIADNMGNVFLPKTKAATIKGYDYGIPLFGIPLETLNDAKYDDPYENIDSMEDNNYARLKNLNERFGDCFGSMITDTGDINDSAVEDFKKAEQCASDYANDSDFKDYQMYLLDNTTIRSLACYEGLDENECTKLGFGGAQPEVSQIVVGDTSNLTCEAGVDGGVVDGYKEGQLYKIRVCIVQGITVNAQIAVAVDQMINSARVAGINITGSGFRTMEGQKEAYERYQSGGNEAARPGYSNHQMGLAIDINYSELKASLAECSANPDRYLTYKWLTANAGKYGFSARVQSECWHWSVTGG